MKNRKRNLRKRVADTSDNEAEETNLAKALEERDERAFKTTGIDSSVILFQPLNRLLCLVALKIFADFVTFTTLAFFRRFGVVWARNFC